MKAEIRLLSISVFAAIIAISPFALAQEGTYSEPAPAAAPSIHKDNSIEHSVKRAASKVKAKTETVYHNVDTKLGNAELTAKAKAALLEDKQTKKSTIHVSSTNGVVTLSGKVNSKATAEHAQEVVAQLVGVRLVRNDLKFSKASDRIQSDSDATDHDSSMGADHRSMNQRNRVQPPNISAER